MRTRDRIALVRFQTHADRLSKSGGRRQSVGLRTDANVPEQPAQRSGFVRVQRPGQHPQPVVAQLMSAGTHGITVRDANGQTTKVRHAHVLDNDVKLTAKERAQFAQALHARGVAGDPQEMFHTGTARRPTTSQRDLLSALVEEGVPLDMDAIRDLATYDDVQALLERYVSDPDGRIASRSEPDALAALGRDAE